MALSDGYKPPEKLRKGFENFLGAVPDERILAFVRGGDVQPRGFRITRQSVPRLRAWLLPFFFRSAPAPESLIRLTREHAPVARATATLSIDALEGLMPWLERLVGTEPLLAAMLLDRRDEVREAARNRLRADEGDGAGEKPGAPSPSLDLARETLAKRIAPLVELSGGKIPPREESSPAVPPAGEHPDGAREKRRRRAMEKRCRDLSQRLEAKNTETAALQARLQRLEEARDQAVSTAETRGEALERLQREFTERVASEVEDRLRDEVFAWLEAPRKAEHALEEASASLLERAEAALERQREHNRHFGNLAEIARRVEELERVRETLRLARREAGDPLPELKTLDRELSLEIERLRAASANRGGESEIAQRLAAGIGSTDAAGLADYASLLDTLKALGALPGNEAEMLDGVLRRRQEKALAESWLREDPKNARPDDPLWLLARAVRHGQRLHVLVDGHNCLFGLRARYQERFDAPDRPGARAREALADDLARMAASHGACRVRLYFDGPERSETGLLPNLRVVYSGGGDRENRADRVLLDYLRYLRDRDSTPVIAVSNDADIRFKARGRGAVPCTPAELERFFEK